MTANDYWLSVSCLNKQSIEAVDDRGRCSYPAGARSHFERCRQECSVGQGAQNPATRWFLGTRAQGKPSEKKWWDQWFLGTCNLSGWHLCVSHIGKIGGFLSSCHSLGRVCKTSSWTLQQNGSLVQHQLGVLSIGTAPKQATVIPKSDPDDLGCELLQLWNSYQQVPQTMTRCGYTNIPHMEHMGMGVWHVTSPLRKCSSSNSSYQWIYTYTYTYTYSYTYTYTYTCTYAYVYIIYIYTQYYVYIYITQPEVQSYIPTYGGFTTMVVDIL